MLARFTRLPADDADAEPFLDRLSRVCLRAETGMFAD